MRKSNPIIYEINRIPVPDDVPIVYIDASYKDGVGSFAFMIIEGDNIEVISRNVPDDWTTEGASGCELYCAMEAIKYCHANRGFRAVGLYFDYVGVYSYLVSRAGDPKIYKEYARTMMNLSQKLDIYYHKADSSNDEYNLVDLVSKAAVRLRIGGEEIGRYRRLVQQG